MSDDAKRVPGWPNWERSKEIQDKGLHKTVPRNGWEYHEAVHDYPYWLTESSRPPASIYFVPNRAQWVWSVYSDSQPHSIHHDYANSPDEAMQDADKWLDAPSENSDGAA